MQEEQEVQSLHGKGCPPFPDLSLEEELSKLCPEDIYTELRKEDCTKDDQTGQDQDEITMEPIPIGYLVRVRTGPKLQCYDLRTLEKEIAMSKEQKRAAREAYTRTPFTEPILQRIERQRKELERQKYCCQGTTLRGERCKRRTKEGMWCPYHRPYRM